MRIGIELRAVDLISSHQFEEEIGDASSENGLIIVKMEFSVRTDSSQRAVWNAVLNQISHQGLSRPFFFERMRVSPQRIRPLYLTVNERLFRVPTLDQRPPVGWRAEKRQTVFDHRPGLHFDRRRRQDAKPQTGCETAEMTA
jgi:hypothetical protein